MRVAITTLGCKINQYDSAAIQSRLESEQHSVVPFDEEADFYIINSCTVTNRADWEARQLVRRAKKLSPRARVLVTGCYAQVNPQEVVRVPGVDFVVGLNRIDALLLFVNAPETGGEKICVGDAKEASGVPFLTTRRLPGHTRAFLKVQEGCNYACTYCIIPAARGHSRSVPPDEILRQISVLAAAGVAEIVLTGIHLGGYGRDLKPRTDLTTLLERIADARAIGRVRLSSLDPREVPQRLLRVLAQSEVFCDHLHICLQSGVDEVLKAMRRNYDTAYYRDLVESARAALPDAALGSDIIVGFPGETEEGFARSMEFLDFLPLTYFHVFPYSVRRGTPAADLPGHIPPAAKKQRARIARELGGKKRREFYRRFIGKRLSVLLERGSKTHDWFRGYSRNYIPVVARAQENCVNREVQVQITSLEGNGSLGVVVEGDNLGANGSLPSSRFGVGACSSHGC
jgi:threonylcarbamoyladenosine tRNA methylthiotransferase MtaB